MRLDDFSVLAISGKDRGKESEWKVKDAICLPEPQSHRALRFVGLSSWNLLTQFSLTTFSSLTALPSSNHIPHKMSLGNPTMPPLR